MAEENAIHKEVGKDGVKLTHPSGETQLITLKQLEKLKESWANFKDGINTIVAYLQADIDAVKEKAV